MKKKNIYFILFTLIIFSGVLTAQESEINTEKKIKVYYNGSFGDFTNSSNEDFYGSGYISTTEHYDIGGISLGFEINKGKILSHEFELLPFHFYNHTDTITIINSNPIDRESQSIRISGVESALRYQVCHTFLSNRILSPYIGASVQLFSSFSKYEPTTTNYYTQDIFDLGLKFSIIPGIKANVSDKWAISLDIPLDFYEIKYHWRHNYNPNIPVENQKRSEIVGTTFPKVFNMRLGLIYKL